MRTLPCTNLYIEAQALRRELEEVSRKRLIDSPKLEVLYRECNESVESRFRSMGSMVEKERHQGRQKIRGARIPPVTSLIVC